MHNKGYVDDSREYYKVYINVSCVANTLLMNDFILLKFLVYMCAAILLCSLIF